MNLNLCILKDKQFKYRLIMMNPDSIVNIICCLSSRRGVFLSTMVAFFAKLVPSLFSLLSDSVRVEEAGLFLALLCHWQRGDAG